ncbi:EamA family transporter [Haloarchaeobius sp. TZWSO28]|uniref:DMT family transporter n=1 Tax=Haloarchaeobius sp. TZWSO28 TaxID=3446119 RepID=UPI003EB86185
MVDLDGLLLALLAALALGTTSILVRLGTQEGKSTDVAMYTFGINVLLLIPVTAVYYYPDYGLTLRAFLAFAAAGATGTLFGRVLFYRSIEGIGASRTEPVKATQPLHAAIIAALVLGESLTVQNLFGILLIILGLAVVSREIVNERKGLQAVPPVMLLVPLGAAFFFGIEPTFAKLGFAEGTPVLVGLVVKVTTATAGMFIYLRWKGAVPSFSFTELEARTQQWIFLAGVTNTCFLFAYYAALAVSPVVFVVPIVQMSPLVVALLSVAFLPRIERVTGRLVGASMIIVAGGVIVTLTT